MQIINRESGTLGKRSEEYKVNEETTDLSPASASCSCEATSSGSCSSAQPPTSTRTEDPRSASLARAWGEFLAARLEYIREACAHGGYSLDDIALDLSIDLPQLEWIVFNPLNRIVLAGRSKLTNG